MTDSSPQGLTHIDSEGRARMVDVAAKDPTHRRAVARCEVSMLPETVAKIASNSMAKGDVLAVARIAGIQAAKQTSTLIPLCHLIALTTVGVSFELTEDCVLVEAYAETVDRTGVEMEAMTACAIAALTIYDMCKAVDRAIVVGGLRLQEKTGGKSGTFKRADDARPLD